MNKKSLTSFQVFFFDFDSTLIKPMMTEAEWDEIKKKILNIAKESNINIEHAIGFYERVAICFQHSQMARNKVLRAIQNHEKKVKNLIPNELVLSALKNALKQNKKVFIISNNSRNVINKFIKETGLNPDIIIVISIENMDLPKPLFNYSSIYKIDSSVMHLSNKSSIYIGDSPTDVEMSRKMGVSYLDWHELS